MEMYGISYLFLTKMSLVHKKNFLGNPKMIRLNAQGPFRTEKAYFYLYNYTYFLSDRSSGVLYTVEYIGAITNASLNLEEE